MSWLIEIWHMLGILGGGMSMLIIVLLVIGIAVLGFVYVSAAIVVLQRFGQAARWNGRTFVSIALVSAAIAAVLARLQVPQIALAPSEVWLHEWLLRFAWVGPMSLIVALLTKYAIRRVSSGRLGLAIGVALLVGISLETTSRTMASDDLSLALSTTAGALIGISFSFVLLGLAPLAIGGLLAVRGGAEWFIATRYLVAERRQVFVSLITLICVGAVAAGVWLIVTVLSVMNGFERTWREEIVGNHAHFLVRSYYGPIVDPEESLSQVRLIDGVVAASPYLEAEGLVRKRGGGVAPIRLRGIEPISAAEVTNLADKVVEGSLDLLVESESRGGGAEEARAEGHPAVIIGKVLAAEIGAGVGDEIVLISPFGGVPTPLGPSPRLMRFRVVGLFQSSFLQYEEVYAYSALPAVRDFLGVDDVVGGFAVKSRDFYRSRGVAAAVVAELGHPFYSRDWKELFPQFFDALKENRSLIVMLLFMIMIVAAFVIVVTLMMMIMAKSADIAILKTMGASDASIERIFAIEGTLIGLSGVTIGVLAGVAVTSQLSWIQQRIEQVTGVDTLPSSVYQISTLPSQVDPLNVIGVSVVAMVLSLGATLLPSRHGARLDPVEGLRHD